MFAIPSGEAGSFLVVFLGGLLFGPPYVWYWLRSVRNGRPLWVIIFCLLAAGYSWTVLLVAIATGKIG